MKIDRLIGILSVLLQEEKVTAPELAEKFEVSRRTINRDIEDLCKAGIPIITSQGVGGGISIMDGYRMDRTILTSRDMQMIIAGLRSLDSVSGSHYYGQLMEKIKAGSSEFVSGSESILIDLSSWYKDSLTMKIELIQTSIEARRVIRFNYYAPSGDSIREIEPYYLIFKWSSWYVWGRMTFCERQHCANQSEAHKHSSGDEFRMFKLTRMDKIVQTEKKVSDREVPMPDLSTEKIFPGGINVKAVFEPSMKWHLIEEFGPDSFRVQPDGTLLFEHEYTDKENLITWLLTCKDKVTVLEPEDIRNELFHIANKILEKYGEINMPRPRNKADLVLAANTNYDKLLMLIESRTENEKNMCYDFSADEKKKEAHWKRDKNLRDVLMHLNEWHLLLLEWIKNRENGSNKPFLMEGYNWKTYGDMNIFFYNRCQNISEEEALEKFKDSHKKVMEALDTFSQDELFTNTYYPWVGGSCIGSYFISVTSSHYDWAMKKIKAHKKNCK